MTTPDSPCKERPCPSYGARLDELKRYASHCVRVADMMKNNPPVLDEPVNRPVTRWVVDEVLSGISGVPEYVEYRGPLPSSELLNPVTIEVNSHIERRRDFILKRYEAIKLAAATCGGDPAHCPMPEPILGFMGDTPTDR